MCVKKREGERQRGRETERERDIETISYLGCRVQGGSGFGVWGLGLRVWGLALRVHAPPPAGTTPVPDTPHNAPVLVLRGQDQGSGSGVRAERLGLRVEGSWLKVEG